MAVEQWIPVGLTAVGFLGTWIFGAFKLGRAVEQIKENVKEEFKQELEKMGSKLDQLEDRFETDQRTQDHNFGEVGAAMRQYIADVEKKVREVEIYGRDNYVKIPDFEKAIDRLSADFKAGVNELKDDIRALLKGGQSN
jgi:hypothetical protein